MGVAIGAVAGLILLIAFCFAMIKDNKTADENKKKAASAAPEKAKVIRIMPGQGVAQVLQVLFEKESGERLNLTVPQAACTFVEGNEGWLKAANNTFHSFTVDTNE